MTGTKQRTALLISNPRAGRGGTRRALEVARCCALLRARGIAVEVAETKGQDDATHLARQAAREGVREVIISGGDGTINEALQGLMGTSVRLGLWPAGTANVLARELALPFDAERLVEVIARGQTRRIYVGCATSEATGARRYFFLMAGVGLDASVVERVRPRLKRRLGEGAFWLSGLGHLARWQPATFNVEIEGQNYPATFAAVGKAAHYGGQLAITPHARLDQPEFEVCLINSQSRLCYLRLLSRAMRRQGFDGSSSARARFIHATRARADGNALVQVDGELIGRLPMVFEIVPDPIEVIAE